MRYEIINPSDAYTLESDDFLAACLATILLGRGAYGLQSEDGKTEMPIMLFGLEETWFPKTFQADLSLLLGAADVARLVLCLQSVVIGSFVDRRAYDVAMNAILDMDGRAAFAAAWHEARRTSLNDIGARARTIAQRLREEEG